MTQNFEVDISQNKERIRETSTERLGLQLHSRKLLIGLRGRYT